MERILVPIDFLEASETACQYALEIARHTGGEILLHHSFYDPVVVTDMPEQELYGTETLTEDVIQSIEENVEKDLEELKTKLQRQLLEGDGRNVVINTELVRGFPDEDIINISEEWNPDLIVMGTRSNGEFMKTIFGSVTAKIIKETRVPVLAVHKGAHFRGFRNIMYATDFDDTDFSAIRQLLEFFSPFKAKIHCLHISTPGNKDIEQKDLEAIRDYFKNEVKHGTVLFDLVESRDLIKGFDRYIDEKNIDLISMTTHKRSFFSEIFIPSITKKMLFHTKVPLLAFHHVD